MKSTPLGNNLLYPSILYGVNFLSLSAFSFGNENSISFCGSPSFISCCRVISDFSAATSFGGLK